MRHRSAINSLWHTAYTIVLTLLVVQLEVQLALLLLTA
jgi:hypothetical protein